jgi:hypothetical protein
VGPPVLTPVGRGPGSKLGLFTSPPIIWRQPPQGTEQQYCATWRLPQSDNKAPHTVAKLLFYIAYSDHSNNVCLQRTWKRRKRRASKGTIHEWRLVLYVPQSLFVT